jgi:hypothetical protein
LGARTANDAIVLFIFIVSVFCRPGDPLQQKAAGQTERDKKRFFRFTMRTQHSLRLRFSFGSCFLTYEARPVPAVRSVSWLSTSQNSLL